MKRQSLYNLVKSHFSKNDYDFIKNLKKINQEIKEIGDIELFNEINKIIKKNTKVTISQFSNKMILSEEQKQIIQILKFGIRKQYISNFFIYGRPGTGKTLFTKNLASELNKEIKIINLSEIIDSKLGESIKKIEDVFMKNKNKIIFIDEVDSIASSRGKSNDLFEINRILNSLLKIIDEIKDETIIICATNLFNSIDKAFLRRFHLVINFDKYSLYDIERIWKFYCKKFSIDKETIFYKKFIDFLEKTYEFWTPSSLENLARVTSLWMSQDLFPFQQLYEILKQINLTKDKAKKAKINQKMIEYFFEKKDNN